MITLVFEIDVSMIDLDQINEIRGRIEEVMDDVCDKYDIESAASRLSIDDQ